MSLSDAIWRYGLLVVSILISTVNIAFLSCGVFAWGSATYTSAAWVVATIGFALFALSFGGCCVSLRESYMQAMVFAASLLLFVLIQIIYVITFAIMKDDIVEQAALRVQQSWAEEQINSGPMRNIEIQYSCCGMEGPQDYLKANAANSALPDSCCWAQDCGVEENIFERGCGSGVVSDVDEQSYYFIWSNVGLIALYLLGAVFAYYHGKPFENVEKKTDEIFINE